MRVGQYTHKMNPECPVISGVKEVIHHHTPTAEVCQKVWQNRLEKFPVNLAERMLLPNKTTADSNPNCKTNSCLFSWRISWMFENIYAKYIGDRHFSYG